MNQQTPICRSRLFLTSAAILLGVMLTQSTPVAARESLTSLRVDVDQNAADISSNYTDIQQNATAGQAAQDTADANRTALCRIAAELKICGDIDVCLGSAECCDATTGGYCWFAGGARESCDTVCAAQGLVYDDEGTRGYAGSDGTTAQCTSVLDDLGVSSYSYSGNLSCAEGVGCGWTDSETLRFRCSSPTTDETSIEPVAGFDAQEQRACACKTP